MISSVLVCFYWLISFADAIFVVSAAFREAKKNNKNGLPALTEKKLHLEWIFLAERGGIIVVQLIIGPVVERASFSDTLFVVVGAELFGHGIGAAFLLSDFLLLYLTRISRVAIQREINDAGENIELINEGSTGSQLLCRHRNYVISSKHIVLFDCVVAFILGVLYVIVPVEMRDIILVILLLFLFCISPLMLILLISFKKED